MVRVRVAAPLSMRACWAAVGCFFIMIDFFFLVLVCSLVDVFYCSTNTARLSTRVDKGAVVWGAVRRVDARHSVVVAGVVLTRRCGSDIVGVVNVTREVSRSRVALSFRLSSNWQDGGL